MSVPLGFMIWRDEDDFCPPGQIAEFTDGQCISLLHKAKKVVEDSGKTVSEIEFKMQLEQDGHSVAENVFKTEDLNSFWLIADPSASDENGSFTVAFVSVFANQPAGKSNYTLKIFADGELFNQGELVYNSDGENTAFKELIPMFGDISGTREQANKEHQQEYAEQNAKEAREQQAAREYKIYIENKDSGHTKYIVATHQTTLSETIYELTPLQTLTLDLFRGSTFELKYYDQDSSKENALFIATVDESCNGYEYDVS
jgi:hypothetical protein